MSGVNPQGVDVHAFKQPTEEELSHDFLWRAKQRCRERGRIGIFNRSYYEEVLVVRVHTELLANEHVESKGKDLWRERFEDINAFERHLVRNGTRILKFFLHISKDEQRRRLLARLDDPSKNWKFSESDATEREYWDQYIAAYESDAERHEHGPRAVVRHSGRSQMVFTYRNRRDSRRHARSRSIFTIPNLMQNRRNHCTRIRKQFEAEKR